MVGFAASRYAREGAEDLAQEVLVVLHEKYSHVERMEELVPLAFQILRFKLCAQRRKAVRRGEHQQVSAEDYPLLGDAPDPETMAVRRDMLERLTKGIALMGKRCQELFRFKLQGRTFPEIRELMGAEALNTVYTWDHRCRKQLLERMGGRWEP
jgi:RNA polymerase sigma-70 factor (ECF subfamily)